MREVLFRRSLFPAMAGLALNAPHCSAQGLVGGGGGGSLQRQIGW